MEQYSSKVMEHFAHPHNVGEIENADGVGTVGNPVCGDVMRLYIKVEKDVITDAMLQQVLLRPAEYDVLATTNLNGDYISDELAAEVGGIGIAPGANLSDTVAMF